MVGERREGARGEETGRRSFSSGLKKLRDKERRDDESKSARRCGIQL